MSKELMMPKRQEYAIITQKPHVFNLRYPYAITKETIANKILTNLSGAAGIPNRSAIPIVLASA